MHSELSLGKRVVLHDKQIFHEQHIVWSNVFGIEQTKQREYAISNQRLVDVFHQMSGRSGGVLECSIGQGTDRQVGSGVVAMSLGQPLSVLLTCLIPTTKQITVVNN
jgi:hypothetical protein